MAKVVVMGSRGSGKTALLGYLTNKPNYLHTYPTYGLITNDVKYNNKTYILWEIPSTSAFSNFIAIYINRAKGGIVMIDANELNSIYIAKDYIRLFKERCPTSPIIVLINRLEDTLYYERIYAELIESVNAIYPIDLKTGSMIDKAFQHLIGLIELVETTKKIDTTDTTDTTVEILPTLSSKHSHKKRRCC